MKPNRNLSEKPHQEPEQIYTCFVEGTDGGRHHKHFTEPDACKEAERLARQPQNKGRKVYVMETIGYCIVPETPVEWYGVK